MLNDLTMKEGIFELEVYKSEVARNDYYFARIKKEGEVVWVKQFQEKEIEIAIIIGKIVFYMIIDTTKYLGNKIDKPYTLDEHKRFIREMSKGKVSIEKFRANFERAVVTLKKDLDKLTEKQLLRRCHFTPTHWDIFNQAYEICLHKFVPGRVIEMKLYANESFISAVRREVYNTRFL